MKGNGVFQDRTEAAGLNVDNDRYSFACTWGDYNSDGWPDLYVANDFGRNCLYRNKGDGTFATVSGGSSCGRGRRRHERLLAGLSTTMGNRTLCRGHVGCGGHARFWNNRIFTVRNRKRFARSTGDTWQATPCTEIWATAQFQNVAMQAGVEMGGWSWSTDAWDFDHDGYQDLYMANGYITGHDGRERLQLLLAPGGFKIAAVCYPVGEL